MINKKISLFQTERAWNEIREQVYDIVDREHQQGKAQKSEIVFTLEDLLAKKFNRKFCVTTGNCSDSLTIACLSLQLNKKAHIGVSNFTFIASAHAVSRAGFIPIPIDIKKNYTINPEKISNVDAVLGVDIFGNISDWNKIQSYGIPTINDAAQSLESHDYYKYSAKYGDVSCISFSPSKTISSWGSGGAILTDDEKIASRAKKLRLHGKDTNSDISIGVGLNSMLSSFEAACIYVGMLHSEKWQQRRTDITRYLIDISRYECYLDDIKKHTYHKLVFESNDRNNVLKMMSDRYNICCGVHYKTSISDENLYKSKNDMFVSNSKKNAVFTVPNQHTLTDDEVELIAEALK